MTPSRCARRAAYRLAVVAAAPAFAQRRPPPPPAGRHAPPPVAPDPATPQGARSYTPADFARFAPRNALDMLNNVPGFSIESRRHRAARPRRGDQQRADQRRALLRQIDRHLRPSCGGSAPPTSPASTSSTRATFNISGLTGQVANIVTAEPRPFRQLCLAAADPRATARRRGCSTARSRSAARSAAPTSTLEPRATTASATAMPGPEIVTTPAGDHPRPCATRCSASTASSRASRARCAALSATARSSTPTRAFGLVSSRR